MFIAAAFFHFVDFGKFEWNIEALIKKKFYAKICEKANLYDMVRHYPVELAYCLALINAESRFSITPPWVLRSYPNVERLMYQLRRKPCLKGCVYCNEALDIYKGLKMFFGFDSYRTYAGEPLQEKAVTAAVYNKSLLAVFPTGGGKSITYQVPALMSGVNANGLTVIISPLQSLMKDQVDNLEKIHITDAVTINGLLDPIERAKSMKRVEDGSASILYISPELLRSRTIERLLLGRNVVRFVIDEAHCFSAWGHDFRVDYMYIGDFIKCYQEKKNLEKGIPVSCFTATAKLKVIEDIRDYFRDKLSIEMEVFRSGAARSNLHYRVFEKDNDDEKYNAVRDLVEEKNCPTIIYVSRRKRAEELAYRLSKDGFPARAFHGDMDKQEKTENQDAFIQGELSIMVATSAFGMGVDKKDVKMVIHYDISDSLENYVQEAGRAGRDEKISADCYVLFNDEDLNKHFILLNQTKVSIQEIQQVWRAIKNLTRFRSKASQSALEIARGAGWDDNISDLETRVRTAISALEEAGYLKRGQNNPYVYADGILVRTAKEAIDRINRSSRFDERQKVHAIRIIRSLIASRSRQKADDGEAESRVDYIADRLALEKREVIEAVNLLREEGILADTKDLIAFIRKRESKNRTQNILKQYGMLEQFLLTVIEREEKTIHIKELNEQAEQFGCKDVAPGRIKTLLNLWTIDKWIRRKAVSANHVVVMGIPDKETMRRKLDKRLILSKFIVEYLSNISNKVSQEQDSIEIEEVAVEFSLLELKEQYNKQLKLGDEPATCAEVEDALFYLSKIGAIKIEGGFLVAYSGMTIERLEKDNRKKYKLEDYEKLRLFYENKIQQIHIVGEYARKMIDDYNAALEFVDDYFQLNYSAFLSKYFRGSRGNEIKRNITPQKFRQLFGELSATQLKIINDKDSKHIVVAAGPGSGKTRILIHKLASLMLMEDVKHEQMLMVTFSRSAVTEFKKRLIKLIGNAANFIEIKTFHSYCFDLLGRVGTIEKSADVIQEAIRKIRSGEVESGRITKTVLVIDEAQDMDANEYDLVSTLMEYNEDMRVIAVGDDDQNIFEFRGSSSNHMKKLMNEENSVLYELIENFRSKRNLVEFSNEYVERMPKRLKKTPIIANQNDNGTIKIFHYNSGNLIEPLVKNILSQGLSGSTCILTLTNEEAMQITGLLLNNNIPARLIQSNEGFNLNKLVEVRFFLNQLQLEEGVYAIDDEAWASAKRLLEETFAGSMNLEVCKNLISDFEATNTRIKYKSDLDIFIRESKLEDFYGGSMETIFVSTIHKAKGREFDNVFLMLDKAGKGFGNRNITAAVNWLQTYEEKRLLYVALTRAKNNLTIHYNGNFLDSIKVEDLVQIYDSGIYELPSQLAIQLSHKDIWLDSFAECQSSVARLMGGDDIKVAGDWCCDAGGRRIFRFSKAFLQKIEEIRHRGYIPKYAKARFVIYWQKENSEYEIRIILPELYFERLEGQGS
ncbi:MAG: RecQ family ATP-dependent DNA helicase [Clostridiaceae bacterium]|jgi:ATP-dependent DNA helicase RecQ|nr:RecQ family ATP-dependent DNA helicase [Clostridiaceae bacterium]